MPIISAQLNKKEIDYLGNIAQENHLFKGDSNEPSIGKAMKKLVEWCQISNVKIGGNNQVELDDSKKMLEQIHSTLPQMMYHLRMQLLFNSETVSDELVAKCKQSSINYLNSTCGEFQDVKYQTITPVDDDNGLNKLPADKFTTKWVAKKI